MILVNGQKLDFTQFPNGETKVNIESIYNTTRGLKDKGINTITFQYEDDSDLLKLMFLKRHIDNTEARHAQTHLRILYMPYSRMDRSEGGSVFTLKYVCELINSLKFDEIEVIEPHSDVTMALLDRAHAYYPTIYMLGEVTRAIGFRNNDYLFFPDAGAAKRYTTLRGYNFLVGDKKRDFETGRINGLNVLGASDLTGKKVIIVDDLCSYGGTFYRKDNEEGVESGAATELKKLGAEEIYLFVTHAEYAITLGSIFNASSPINKVFSTNSIYNPVRHGENSKHHIFNII